MYVDELFSNFSIQIKTMSSKITLFVRLSILGLFKAAKKEPKQKCAHNTLEKKAVEHILDV